MSTPRCSEAVRTLARRRLDAHLDQRAERRYGTPADHIEFITRAAVVVS